MKNIGGLKYSILLIITKLRIFIHLNILKNKIKKFPL